MHPLGQRDGGGVTGAVEICEPAARQSLPRGRRHSRIGNRLSVTIHFEGRDHLALLQEWNEPPTIDEVCTRPCGL